jgi:cysteine desulfurase
MGPGRVYLDWNATAPLRAEARAAVLRVLDAVGNPSSVHQEGRHARWVVEDARASVAALVGADPRNVTFTSGGTEANMLALGPGLRAGSGGPCGRLLVSAIEHPSCVAGGRFAPEAIETVPVDRDGVVDLAALERRLAVGAPPPLVSIMLANNETGVIQPVSEAAAMVHAAGGLLHVDAVQAAGRIPIDINALQVDLMTVSAHKIGGPQGVGALVRRDGSMRFPAPLIRGGGQERGLRAGTENVAAIAGFGAAAAAAQRSLARDGDHQRALRDRLQAGLRRGAPEAVIFGAGVDRVPNTVLFASAGIAAETALISLDLDGVAASSGSACSSGKVTPSHVLAAMGVEPELARGAIRVSLGFATTEEEIERLLSAWEKLAQSLSKRRQGIAA